VRELPDLPNIRALAKNLVVLPGERS